LGYAALASIVQPAGIDPVILADPDDNAVLACGVAAQVEIIVSGDNHLLGLSSYRDIRILTAAELVAKISELDILQSKKHEERSGEEKP